MTSPTLQPPAFPGANLLKRSPYAKPGVNPYTLHRVKAAARRREFTFQEFSGK
jgi:hypothetical protein